AGTGDDDVSRDVAGGQLPAHGCRGRRRDHGGRQQRVRSLGGGTAPGDRAAGDAQGRAADPRRDPRGPRVGPVGAPQGRGRPAAARGPAVGGALRSTRPRGTGARGDPQLRWSRASRLVPRRLARRRLMRFHFDPTLEQRAALEAQLARLQQTAPALELLAAILPAGFAPAGAICTLRSAHSDRFVVQVRVRSHGGEERVYALKAYSDDFGERVWAHAQRLAEHLPPQLHRPSFPIRYLPQQRVLVFDWVEGQILSKIVDGRKQELLRQAAALAADLHRAPLVPERPTTAQMLVAAPSIARARRRPVAGRAVFGMRISPPCRRSRRATCRSIAP